MNTWTILSLLFLAELAVLTYITQYVLETYREFKNLKANGEFVKGRITGFTTHVDHDQQRYFSAVVEYCPKDEQIKKFRSGMLTATKPRINREITLIYRKKNPSDVMLQPDQTLYRRIAVWIAALSVMGILDYIIIMTLK